VEKRRIPGVKALAFLPVKNAAYERRHFLLLMSQNNHAVRYGTSHVIFCSFYKNCKRGVSQSTSGAEKFGPGRKEVVNEKCN
jgi:hypothetical protein